MTYDTLRLPAGKNVSSDFIDYNLHLNLKTDFIIHKNIQMIRKQGLESLQRQCQIENTQILNILQTARIDSSLAGFLLTGNRSNFLET
jgi:hypothetical protein